MTLCLPDYKILIREIKQMNQSLNRSASALAMLGLLSSTAFAADGFKLRYPFQGSLGGEIAAPLNQPGWFASLAVVGVDINKNSGPDGNDRQLPLPAQSVPMPSLADLTNRGVSAAAATQLITAVPPTLVRPGTPISSLSTKATLKLSQQQTNAALIVGYAFEQLVAGGRIVANVQLPYTAQLDRKAEIDSIAFSTTPAGLSAEQAFRLNLYSGNNPSLNAYNQINAGAQTEARAKLARYANANSGKVSGQGDAEVTGAWTYVKDSVKVAAGLTLALPTGDYNKDAGQIGPTSDPIPGINIGFGNYYTLRPGLAVAYSPTPDWTIGAKASYGANTRNKDNDIKSGDYVGIDLAAVYKTSIGVIGPHFMYVNQIKDDTYGDKSSDQSKLLGANRFNIQGAGIVFTTLIPGIDAGLTLSYMNTIDSKNALAGSFTMVRLTKKF